MRTVTLTEASSPPDREWLDTVCKIGQGAACCRYVICGPNGFGCARWLSGLADQIDIRAGRGDMKAVAINCVGRSGA